MRLKTLTATNPGGNALLEYGYEYDGSGNIVRKTTEDGTRSFMRLTQNANSAWQTVTEETYDENGNRSQLKEAVGSAFERLTDYGYDENNNLTTITKHLGGGQSAVTQMLYDENGNLSWKQGPDGQEVSYVYSDGQLDSMTTSAGTWSYSYDDDGRLTGVSDPFGTSNGREYDDDGNVTAVTQNGTTVASYTYVDGNLTSRTDAAGQSYSYEYNADGQLVRQTGPGGVSQSYEYDDQGRLWKSIDASGNEIVREYSAVSNGEFSSSCSSCSGSLSSDSSAGVERLTKIIYPTFSKEFRYDEEGRVSDEIYTLSSGETLSVSNNYDSFGRLQSTTGPGGTTTYHYDLLGRKIQVDDPSGSTKFGYDAWGNLQNLTDAANQRTEFVYDSSGRLTQERRPMQQSTGYEYDSQGRLWKILDAKQQTTEYGYDGQGRLEAISYADGRSVTLSYDPSTGSGQAGNLAGYDDGTTSAAYTYDALGRKLSETVNYGAFSKSFSYSYHPGGQKASFTAPDGTTYEYAYGQNNELREVKIPGLGAITVAEYQWNRPTTILYPGGGKRELEYDGLMRLNTLTAKDPGGNSVLEYAYEYDGSGNIVTKSTEHGEYAYGYDSASRLTSAENPTGDDESYVYDAVGNRTSASNATGSISHNANNELLSYGEIEYEYDENGNLTQKKLGNVAVNYIYNADNRLVKVEDELTGNTIAEYYYDPFGRRLWKEVSGVRTYFFYSDEGLIAEFDAAGNETRSYGYKPDSTWTTDPLFLTQNGQYYFYQNDYLGTPQKLVAQNGAVVWQAIYSAFGEADVKVETVTNNLRFPGQYVDNETGLHYNFHRYYSPTIASYLTSDPLKGLNLYVYAENNPLSGMDVLGLATIFIDPGHGDRTSWVRQGKKVPQDYFQPGGVSKKGLIWEQCGKTGYCEKDLALTLAKAIGERLERLGHTVIYSRDGDVDDVSREFIQWRIDKAIESEAEYLISVHLDDKQLKENHLGVLYYDDPMNQSSYMMAEQMILSIAGKDRGMCPFDACEPVPTVYGIQRYRFTENVFESLRDAGLSADLVKNLRKNLKKKEFDTKDALLKALKAATSPQSLSKKEEDTILKIAAIPIKESTVEDYSAVIKDKSKRWLWMPQQLDPQVKASVLLEAGDIAYIDKTLKVIESQEFIDRVVRGIDQGITKIEEENCPSQ